MRALWETAKQPKSGHRSAAPLILTRYSMFGDVNSSRVLADRLIPLTAWLTSLCTASCLLGKWQATLRNLTRFKDECFAITCGCFCLSRSFHTNGPPLPSSLPSPRVNESSSGAVGVRAGLRQHKPANSLLQIPPIPLHSLLIPGLIIPRLWQSPAAQKTSTESALNRPAASILCVEQTSHIHLGPLGGVPYGRLTSVGFGGVLPEK